MSDYYIPYTYLSLNLFLKKKVDYIIRSSIIYKLFITKQLYYSADQIVMRMHAELIVRIEVVINR